MLTKFCFVGYSGKWSCGRLNENDRLVIFGFYANNVMGFNWRYVVSDGVFFYYDFSSFNV